MTLIKPLKTIHNAQGNNMKISGVYKITNTVTNDFYIGSSKDVKRRWAEHKCPSTWNKHPNNPLYLDMQKYGVDKLVFEILAEVESESLKEKEQQFIEKLQPTYNSNRANGWDIKKYNECQKEYHKEYRKSGKYKKYQIEYRKAHKDKNKEYQKKYNNQLCCYNGQTLTLNALRLRFQKAGIAHSTIEAKKYLVCQ